MRTKESYTKNYKGKYFLALYDCHDEWCVGVFDTARELANHIGCSVNSAQCQIGRVYRGQTKRFGDGRHLHFIELSSEEMSEEHVSSTG